MMNKSEALERINEIQRIAERTTLYSMLPGSAAIIGGIIALAASAISYQVMASPDVAVILNLPVWQQLFLAVMWVVLIASAVVIDIVFTTREARRKNLVLGRPGKLAALSLTPALMIALLITIRMMVDLETAIPAHAVRYLPPIWIMSYGVGIYSAGLFSVKLPRYFGIAFIIMGALNLLVMTHYGILFVALSFGLLHILFGSLVLHRKRLNA
jgi:hypothetical protein